MKLNRAICLYVGIPSLVCSVVMLIWFAYDSIVDPGYRTAAESMGIVAVCGFLFVLGGMLLKIAQDAE